jgi:hypothetical protein
MHMNVFEKLLEKWRLENNINMVKSMLCEAEKLTQDFVQ